jgi:thiol-disulfide isomerase/thioredoxin
MTTETAPNATSRRAHQKLIVKRVTLALVALVCVALLIEGFQAMGVAPDKARDFTTTTLDGKKWSLSERLGKKPVLLSFFATWCGPCAQEFPHLVELQKQHPDLEIVMLTREEPALLTAVPTFKTVPFTFVPNAGPVFDQYKVDSIPHTVFFDRKGKLAEEIEGYAEGALDSIGKKLTN